MLFLPLQSACEREDTEDLEPILELNAEFQKIFPDLPRLEVRDAEIALDAEEPYDPQNILEANRLGYIGDLNNRPLPIDFTSHNDRVLLIDSKRLLQLFGHDKKLLRANTFFIISRSLMGKKMFIEGIGSGFAMQSGLEHPYDDTNFEREEKVLNEHVLPHLMADYAYGFGGEFSDYPQYVREPEISLSNEIINVRNLLIERIKILSDRDPDQIEDLLIEEFKAYSEPKVTRFISLILFNDPSCEISEEVFDEYYSIQKEVQSGEITVEDGLYYIDMLAKTCKRTKIRVVPVPVPST